MLIMLPSAVVIHCQPEMEDFLKKSTFEWEWNNEHDGSEIDLFVDDIPYDILRGDYQDPDEALCEHYGIDYNHVNCIEALY